MNGKTEHESVEYQIRSELRESIEELRAAETEIAFLRREIAVKDEYIAFLKAKLGVDAASEA